jgi:hypothetical protein
MQHVGTTQLALPLGALLGQDVAAMGMIALKTACGLLESLCCAAIGFQFRHDTLRLNFGIRIFSS